MSSLNSDTFLKISRKLYHENQSIVLQRYAEFLLACYGMPTLLKMKPSCLFRVHTKGLGRAEHLLKVLEEEIKHFECEAITLYSEDFLQVVLIYHEKLLMDILTREENRSFLKTTGFYDSHLGLEQVLEILKHRYECYIFNKLKEESRSIADRANRAYSLTAYTHATKLFWDKIGSTNERTNREKVKIENVKKEIVNKENPSYEEVNKVTAGKDDINKTAVSKDNICYDKPIEEDKWSINNFPHEIGIFLGYPLADVEGFMKNNGKNYLISGYWKVYQDAPSAILMFQQYKKARDDAIQWILSGKSLRDFRNI